MKQEVYQYTQFAVSEYREKVAALVKFRNQFAECPFVCRTITTPDNVQVRRERSQEFSIFLQTEVTRTMDGGVHVIH